MANDLQGRINNHLQYGECMSKVLHMFIDELNSDDDASSASTWNCPRRGLAWPSTSGLMVMAVCAQRQRFVYSSLQPAPTIHTQPQCTLLAPFFSPLPCAESVSVSQKRSYRTSGQQDKPWRRAQRFNIQAWSATSLLTPVLILATV